MKKNIKRIMALVLVVGTLSAIGTATKYTNLFTTEAHAASADAHKLKSLQLETSDGDSLDVYEDNYCEDKLSDNLAIGGIYFAKTSADKIKIESIDGANADNVRIFIGSSDKAYKLGDDISLSQGTTTTLKVRVYEDEYNEDKYYSSSNYNPYTIIVKNTTTNDDADLL